MDPYGLAANPTVPSHHSDQWDFQGGVVGRDRPRGVYWMIRRRPGFKTPVVADSCPRRLQRDGFEGGRGDDAGHAGSGSA